MLIPFRSRRSTGLESNPFPKYAVTVSVRLYEPIEQLTHRGTNIVVGYFRNLGVACRYEDLEELLDEEIVDGDIDWQDTTVGEVDPSTLNRAIRDRIEPLPGRGVWYRSGHAFYGP